MTKNRQDVNITAPILSFSGTNLHSNTNNNKTGSSPQNRVVGGSGIRTNTATSTSHGPGVMTAKILQA